MEIAALVVAIVSAGMSAFAVVYARRADRRADQALPSADYLGHRDEGGQRVYRFRVTNTGAHTASGTRASLIDSDGDPVDVVELDGDHVEEGSFKHLVPRVLTPQSTAELEMSIRQEDLRKGPLRLRFDWSDKAGSPPKISDAKVPTG
jgi:hypothetical protein